MIVLDTSYAIDAASDARESRLREAIAGDHVVAPSIFMLECVNVMVGFARRGDIRRDHVLAELEVLKTFTDDTVDVPWQDVLQVSLDQNLAAYDAAYLALAIDLGATLATRDRALAAAAERVGVPTLS